jgi:uncharacterized protein
VTSAPEYTYRPAWWVPGPHAQTLWSRFLRRLPRLPLRRQRIDTPDGDFLDLLHMDAPAGRPRLLLLHGLEGTPASHYVSGLFDSARQRGWGATLMLFRGCGGELNRAPRFYHSGETGDLRLVLDHLRQLHTGQLVIAGVSLGGNVMLKWLGEEGDRAAAQVSAAAAISVPYDLERGARHLQQGFARVYDRHFLRSLRRKALSKLARHPGAYDQAAVMAARTLVEFDDAVTAPLHGFRDASDYYQQSSSLHYLHAIRVPTLLLSARDDPFLPVEVLDDVRHAARDNDHLTLEFVQAGGHVGFVGGRLPWRPDYYAERRAIGFLSALAPQSRPPSAPGHPG